MQHTTYGEIWENRHSRNQVGGRLNKVKVGTGTKAESESDTGLASKSYGSADPSEVNIIESPDGTQTTYYIELQGAQNIPAGTEITEFGVFVNGTKADGTAVDFGDLEQYTDADGDLMYLRDTESLKTIGDGSFVVEQLTVSWRHV